YLMADRKENYEARADIVKEFVGYIREFTSTLDETKVDVLTAFLETVALFSATDDVEELNGRVSMMTLHSAKGLEFPFVFLTGLEDGLFPSTQSIYDPEKLEEERRLCYVGITRAKEKLYLSTAKQRMLYGKIAPSLPSRFLVELQDALPESAKPAPKPAPKSAPPQQAFGISMHTLKSGSHHPQPQPASRDMTRAEPKIEEREVAYSGGQRVRHKSFGEGTVLNVNGSGSSAIVEIAFDSGANKKFAAAFAPIDIIE
ncbi:MAG: 3'-5' exonuclease, partial [Clostridiaceae bacterium]